MLEIIIAIYGLLIWLIFIKFKLLPWNIKSQVAVVALGLFGVAVLVFTINVVTPSTNDVRVTNYVVEVVPRVTGRVVEVPIGGNKLVKRGEVLLKIDPEPFQIKVKQLEAQLVESRSDAAQTEDDLRIAQSTTSGALAQYNLALVRLKQSKELAAQNAGPHYDVDQYLSESNRLKAAWLAAKQNEDRIRVKLHSMVGGDRSSVAVIKAQLEAAKWELEQTVIYAPTDGYAINLQVREGSYAAALPLRPVMTFVETSQQVIAFFDQNQLTKVTSGNEVEIALISKPGQILKGRVDSIVWATAQGQFQASGALPTTAPQVGQTEPPLRYAVRIKMEHPEDLTLAMGARGDAAIYTDKLSALHLVRKVIIRVSSKLNYLIFKLH